MADFFISDLHLQPGRTDLANAFYRFTREQLKPDDSLYILGDFFDAWIGDDEDEDFYLTVKKHITDTTSNGNPICFIHGNRDFLLGSRFVNETGIKLLSEPYPLKLHNDNVLLLHGDSLCTDDIEYMQFRRQVRDPQWQQQILSLPLHQRRLMAAELRAKSKSMTSNKAADIMDVNQQEVKKLFLEYNVSKIIHGHTHRPKRHKIESGEQNLERIVLGDWDKNGWFLKVVDGEYDLINFPI